MERKVNVLIVDGNRDDCSIISDYLSTYEYINVVGMAYDGIRALELIKDKEPDLILFGVIMHQLEDVDAIESIRSINLKSVPKIVVFSYIQDETISNKVAPLGADYFIDDLFGLDTFIRIIEKLFV